MCALQYEPGIMTASNTTVPEWVLELTPCGNQLLQFWLPEMTTMQHLLSS